MAEAKAEAKEVGGEAKGFKGEGKAEFQIPKVDVERIDVESGPLPLTDQLDLEIDFKLDRPLRGACWKIKYMVDSVRRRHIIELGETEVEDYDDGSSSFMFSVPSIDISAIKPSSLSNAGLLIATLVSQGREIIDINMVVQVSQDGEDFTRVIYNPLE